MSVFLLVLGIFLFGCLVIIHEFGHFIVARRNGVKVEEFGLGFPPKAITKKTKSGFVLSLNWIPFGGFVKLKGEHDADTSPGSFGKASLWAKTKIMAAGVGMNLLAAFVMLTILAFVGIPQLFNNQYTVPSNTKIIRNDVIAGSIQSNSPASEAGLKLRDKLVSIGLPGQTPQPITNATTLPSITKEFAGKTVDLKYYEGSQLTDKAVKLRSQAVVSASQKTSNPVGYLGISPINYTLQKSTWAAPIVALGLMKQITVLTLKGIGNALVGLFTANTAKASSQVAGPVGVVVLLKDFSQLGYQFVLVVIAIISLSLAIINILPIPALDGGRLFFTLIPRLLLKRPLKQTTEDWIHGAGLAVLFGLLILVTISDISHIQ